MTSTILKRSIVIAGHKTSVSLEDDFWRALKDIAWSSRTTLSALVNSINSERKHGNLSSAVRLFVLNHYKERAHTPARGALANEKLGPEFAHLNGVP